MISQISQEREETHLVPLIFLDTLYHFPQTLALAQEASERYLADLHTFRPADAEGKEFPEDGAKEFERVWGEKLWAKDDGGEYDYLVKVRPQSLSLLVVPASPLGY